MNAGARPGRRAGARWRLWAALTVGLAAGGGAATAGPAAGQVVDRELAYRSALSQHRAALDAWSVVEKQWNDAIDEHGRARRAGDDERVQAVLVRALDLARELDRLERRVAEEGERLEAARASLLGALDARIDILAEQLTSARTAGERTRLTTLLRDLENQQARVESDGDSPGLRVELVYYPSIQFDPRDTRETLGFKAQLLRSKAEQADSTMAGIDREIERIERQMRRDRSVQSFLSGIERFGDVQPPVGAPNRTGAEPGEVRARPDSAGVSRPAPTPEQRLQELHLLRLQVSEMKRQFLDRAVTFDELVRRIG